MKRNLDHIFLTSLFKLNDIANSEERNIKYINSLNIYYYIKN